MAVTATVRLVALNLERRQELQARMDSLRRARDRTVVASDRQRAETAARLRTDVVDPLARTAAVLRRPGSAGEDPVAVEAVEIAVRELDSAVEEIQDLVAGVPSAALGSGRLRAAVEALAARSPLAVEVAGRLSATAPVEAALFYVCSEALVNAEKHSGGGSVVIELHEDERSVSVS